MDSPKQRLAAKLIAMQQQMIHLTQASKEQDKSHQEYMDTLFLEIMEVLDGFENIFSSLNEKQDDLNKTTKRALNSFKALQRKLLRVLSTRSVTPIMLPENKAVVGLCKVIETRPASDAVTEPGAILAQIRQGYQREDRVLRPTEVITAEGSALLEEEVS